MFPTADNETRGTFIEQQVKGLRECGLEVDVLHLDRREGLRVYAGVKKKLDSAIQSFDPDIVHVMYGGAMAELATRSPRLRPMVVSFCGSDLLGDVGRGFLLRNTLGRYGVAASHIAARRADGVIVKSAELRDAAVYSADPSRVWILPNGIDLARFKPMSRGVCQSHLGWRSDRFQVLFPGGTRNPRKRLDLATAAVSILRRAGVPAELQILEGVAHADVPLWLNAADALILCSIHEGSPNIIKEALACNVPIVSVDVGDVKKRIESIAGCFLTNSSAEDLAYGLRSVFLGRRRVEGRARVQDLSIEGVATALIKIYETVLANAFAAPADCRALAKNAGAASD